MQHAPFPHLPCSPCPHQSACCSYGAALTADEAQEIRVHHGAGLVYRNRWGDWRTRVVNGRCSLLQNNACTIYNQPYFPAVCRGFPWLDAETGGPYEFDRTICPEFTRRPELLQINPFVRAPKSPGGSARRKRSRTRRRPPRSRTTGSRT